MQKRATSCAIVCVLSIATAASLSAMEDTHGGIEQMLLFLSVVVTIVTFVLTAIFSVKYSQQKDSQSNAVIHAKPDATKKLPGSKKKQVELASSILSSVEVCIDLANETDRVSFFVDWYDEAIDGFSTLAKLEKVKFTSPPAHDLYRLKDEFQWHLCDAIVRAKKKALSDIRDKYRNSREFQIRAANAFEEDISSVQDRFSKDTAELAKTAVEEVKMAAKLDVWQTAPTNSLSPDAFAQYGDEDAELLSIDLMEGHAFEHWCAQLLRDLGYTEVSVTQGSGDQGVDVLAQKDGIKFAIQCKCYTSDLGNTPVQEVNAGKTIYHCHIGVVMTNRFFTTGAKQAADATGVLLWDRDWIRNAISKRNIVSKNQSDHQRQF